MNTKHPNSLTTNGRALSHAPSCHDLVLMNFHLTLALLHFLSVFYIQSSAVHLVQLTLRVKSRS